MATGFYFKNTTLFHIVSSVVIISLFISCKNGNEQSYNVSDGMIWNTTYHIIYKGEPSLTDSILPVLNEVSKSLNFFDDNSLLSKVNSAKDTILIDTHLINVYKMAMRISEASGGMFDPTVSPLIDAWGFGKGHNATADTLNIDSLLRITGIKKTRLKENILIKQHPLIKFNFSAIAKGYGCDQIAEMFKINGIQNYLIEIGGEIAASGKNRAGKEWQISIDKPVLNENGIIHESQQVVHITSGGMATSGNYRNFHRNGNATYGHTISPLTGRPAKTDVLSATVIAPTTMQADAMATACMALGSKEALKMCSRLNCAVYLILADTTIMSENFKRYL